LAVKRPQVPPLFRRLISRENRAVALKVLENKANLHELAFMKRLQVEKNRNLPGTENVVHLLDHFEHWSDDKSYPCLVIELMWQSALEFCRGFEDETRVQIVRHISKQILRGAEFLSNCGIIHNGIPIDSSTHDRSSSREHFDRFWI
jgi:serine/threonine protein kinase